MINIRYKLLAAFLLTIGLIWVNSAATLYNGMGSIKIFHDLTDDVIPGAGTMSAIKYQAAEIEAETFEHIMNERLLLDHETAKADLYEKYEKIEQTIDQIRNRYGKQAISLGVNIDKGDADNSH